MYTLVSGPGAVDAGQFVIALVCVWFGYSLAVGAIVVTLYTLPLIWLLLRMRIA